MPPIRLLLADDHRLFTAGLAELLERERDFTVVGTAASDGEAIGLAARTHPDVVLLDLHLPEHGGIAAIHSLKSLSPPCEVILLTLEASEEVAVTAIRAGASGYLLKEIAVDELMGFIRAALGGDIVISPSLATGVLRQLALFSRRPAAPEHSSGLSAREQQVFELIGQGLSNREIAAKLSLSENTVRHYTTDVYRKLGVTRRSQAVRRALSRSSLPPAD